jgi:uncharacterized protein YecT (DUF1311 family)
MRGATLVALLLLGAPAAHAAGCNDNSNQMQLNQCASDELARANAGLNAAYQALMKKIEAPNQAQLRDAQRAWIAFRDKECTFETGGGASQGGSIWPMMVDKCLTTLTQERTKALQAQVKCQSWDLSCPG